MKDKLELLKQLEEALTPETPNYKFEEEKLLKEIPKGIKELFEEDEESFFIAGGAITSIFSRQSINDIDIYPKTTFAKLKLIDWMQSSTGIQTITEKSIYGICNGNFYINLVLLENSSCASDIFSKFDFTINMGAYDFDNKTFTFHKDFFRDLASRYIRVNENTLYPLVSVMRTEKYKERGYFIPKNEVAKLLLKTSTLKLESIKDVENHLGGMYGIDFETLLEKDEEFSIDKICNKLSETSTNYEEYYKIKKEKFDSKIEELITAEINVLIEEGFFKNVYRFNKTLFIKKEEIYDIFEFEFDIPKSVILPEVPEEAFIYLYKNVMKKDNKYYSYYRKSFEYILNEEIKPEGSDYLYFYPFKSAITGTYNKEKDRYILKAKVNIKDIHSFGSAVMVKKCIPIEAEEGELYKEDNSLPF